jgi:hypothetical protein
MVDVQEGPAIPVAWNAHKQVLPGSVQKITRVGWDNGIVWEGELLKKKIKWFHNPNLGLDIPTYMAWKIYKIKREVNIA